MKNFERCLLYYYLNNEGKMDCMLKNTIRTIANLSDSEKESFKNYVMYNWIEYVRSVLNGTYVHIDLTSRVYNSWLKYRKNL